ncbi:protein of unknown function [Streptomyces sp. KY75]|nr:protein of unknown function [Streptomyces sp. KY75]
MTRFLVHEGILPGSPLKHRSPGQNDSAWGHSVGRVGLEPTADGL